MQGSANKSETTTLKAQTTKDPQHTDSEMRQKLQRSTQHQLQTTTNSNDDDDDLQSEIKA
jgi:hypothetical protein